MDFNNRDFECENHLPDMTSVGFGQCQSRLVSPEKINWIVSCRMNRQYNSIDKKYITLFPDETTLNAENLTRSKVQIVNIDSSQLNQRLDNFLIKVLKDVPKSRIYRIIRKGEVRVNKRRCKSDYKLQMDDQVRIPPVRIDETDQKKHHIPQRFIDEISNSIIFQNKHLLIINKPAGIAVHSGSGVPFGVIDILRQLHPQLNVELVHRLDRDTSGCLMIAIGRKALLTMQNALQESLIRKVYLAAVAGKWPKETKDIKLPLKKITIANGERRVMVDESGQKAHTKIQQVEYLGECSLLHLELITGRTHQIRVHCQSSGFGIVGDDKYGDKKVNRSIGKQGLKRMLLHAARLELPKTDYCPEIVVNAPIPEGFDKLQTLSI